MESTSPINDSQSTTKLKQLTCQYCERHFRRLEHVRRHERTHTKETPFKCPCGRAFNRCDLLRRHEKTAHTDGNFRVKKGHEASTKRNACARGDNGFLRSRANSQHNDAVGAPVNVLQLLDQRQKENGHDTPPTEQVQSIALNTALDKQSISQGYVMRAEDGLPEFWQGGGVSSGYLLQNGASTQWWDDFDWDISLFPPDFGPQPIANMPLPMSTKQYGPGMGRKELHSIPERDASIRAEQCASFSRLGSPLPPLQPDSRDLMRIVPGQIDQISCQRPCWKLSNDEYIQLLVKLQEYATVLPKDFSLPSRHTVSRFLKGCIDGLFEHLPFVHIATFSATTTAVELLLAMMAIGAHFRFETHRGNVLFYAAKTVVLERINRQSRKEMSDILTCPYNLIVDAFPPPDLINPRHGVGKSIDASGASAGGHDNASFQERNGSLQTLQALLTLLVMGAWGPRQLVKEAISIQNLAASFARECGLSESDEHYSTNLLKVDWHSWIQKESYKRTLLSVYSFLNLMCLAYNQPPMILTSEVHGDLPASTKEWRAKTSKEWEEAFLESTMGLVPFQWGVESLFSYPSNRAKSLCLPPLASYTLIFAILQRIYFLRQADSGSNRKPFQKSLRPEDVEEISRALRSWQALWERSPESNVEPQSVTGPVAFNSTALLRLAWIRLHSDFGAYARLASRDSALIAAAIIKSPPLQRNTTILQPIRHAAHALAVPVRMGIAFVAKTQTTSWSVQHSLSSLECAIFLSKWLEQIALTSSEQPVSMEEQTIISMLEGMLQETGFFDDAANSISNASSQKQRIILLATSVARLWVEIFKGTHVFDMANTIGATLDTYAGLMASVHTPRNST